MGAKKELTPFEAALIKLIDDRIALALAAYLPPENEGEALKNPLVVKTIEVFDLEADEQQDPALPDLTDIKPLEETEADPMPHNVPGFDWSEDKAWALVPVEDERWAKVVEWVILKGATREQLNSFQEQKQVRFGKQNRDVLENLIWFREELLKGKKGAFDLNGILGQNQTDELQKGLWLRLAKENKLQ